MTYLPTCDKCGANGYTVCTCRKPESVTANDIRKAILRSWKPPEWIVAFEVANRPGFDGTRRLDAVGFSSYPSRGLKMVGVEIKVSRGDFLAEMRQPEKAGAFATHLDEMWIYTAKGVVDGPHEIPDAWGWKVLYGDRLVTKKRPKPLDGAPDKAFFACFIRAMSESQEHIRRAMEADLSRKAKDMAERMFGREKAKLDEREKAIEALRERTEMEHKKVSDLLDTLPGDLRYMLVSSSRSSDSSMEVARRLGTAYAIWQNMGSIRLCFDRLERMIGEKADGYSNGEAETGETGW